ncbi:MAG: hypothetical protein DRO93_05190 [Candidatus Thorarchaeota archaeon]|nr:MAG: hypothetical protein DRO93_05190 [Candidatus Thorarchaeota archaeon]
MAQNALLLQFLPPNQLLAMLLGVGMAILVGGLVVGWSVRERRRITRLLDELLLETPIITLTEIANKLGMKRVDHGLIMRAAKGSRNGVLDFTRTAVVSIPLLRARLRRLLHDESVIHTLTECDYWGIPESLMGTFIESVAQEEGLDVILTTDGNYVVVPELKERMRDVLDLQGRIEALSEAQRLGVDPDALIHLVTGWGWDLVDIGSGTLYSASWLRLTLERMVARDGAIDLQSAAERIGATPADVERILRYFDWPVLKTHDGRLLPLHLVEERLAELLETKGVVDLRAEADRMGIKSSELMKVLRRRRRQLVESDHGEVFTLDYIRKRIYDDVALQGWIDPRQEAKALGVSRHIIEQILGQDKSFRRTGDKRYISLRRFRSWLLEEIKHEGLIRTARVEKEWGLSGVDLALLLKQFGLKTTPTRDGNYLSLAWARHRIRQMVESGRVVTPSEIAKKFSVEEGIAAALIASVEADALQTRDGSLVPESVVRRQLRKRLDEKGVVNPEEYAKELGIDVSDVIRALQSAGLECVETRDGRLFSVVTLVSLVRRTLGKHGVCDLRLLADRLHLSTDELVRAVHSHIQDREELVGPVECIVDLSWVERVQRTARESGRIQVSEFARRHRIRRRAALGLLRRYVRGAYISSLDSYVALRPER